MLVVSNRMDIEDWLEGHNQFSLSLRRWGAIILSYLIAASAVQMNFSRLRFTLGALMSFSLVCCMGLAGKEKSETITSWLDRI